MNVKISYNTLVYAGENMQTESDDWQNLAMMV